MPILLMYFAKRLVLLGEGRPCIPWYSCWLVGWLGGRLVWLQRCGVYRLPSSKCPPGGCQPSLGLPAACAHWHCAAFLLGGYAVWVAECVACYVCSTPVSWHDAARAAVPLPQLCGAVGKKRGGCPRSALLNRALLLVPASVSFKIHALIPICPACLVINFNCTNYVQCPIA